MLSPPTKIRLMTPWASEFKSHPMQIRFRQDESVNYVNIEYLGRLAIAVSGEFTGRLYRFSPVQPTQQVDSRDAFHLLASRRFGVAP